MKLQKEAPVKRLIDRYEAETLLVFKPSRNLRKYGNQPCEICSTRQWRVTANA